MTHSPPPAPIIELDSVYNIDCIVGMQQMRAQGLVADWLITDPPYGIGIDGQKEYVARNPKHSRKAHAQKAWDTAPPDKRYFDLMFETSHNQIVFGANYFNEYLSQGKKGWVVWDKGQRGLTMSDCELIYTSSDNPTRIITHNRVDLLKDGTFHPTQKPLSVLIDLINAFTKAGDIILDPFAGSLTTAVACHKLGRRYICFELDPDYYTQGIERLNAVKAQVSIFDLFGGNI